MTKTKAFIYILLVAAMPFTAKVQAQADSENDGKASTQTAGDDKIVMLNKDSFIKKVWDYTKNEQKWVYEGKLPCIIDFYADWCQPCKRVEPILKELAKEYSGKIIVYKIDTEKERELASVFGVRSIPTFLFVPVQGDPVSGRGAMPREDFVKAIHDYLLKDNKKETK